jgi:hypothetical protein
MNFGLRSQAGTLAVRSLALLSRPSGAPTSRAVVRS